jgi:hypothetical protein
LEVGLGDGEEEGKGDVDGDVVPIERSAGGGLLQNSLSRGVGKDGGLVVLAGFRVLGGELHISLMSVCLG